MPKKRKRRAGRVIGRLLLVLLLLVVGSATWFLWWANGKIERVDVLSGAADTPGTTYLIVGSDSREGWGWDGTEGARTDTIILIHEPESGPTAMISIPRDSYVSIPGYSDNKINASFAFGGPPLLIETVEGVTGLTIDHYLEIGFQGVSGIVDALSGVELCYGSDVDDELSGMVWEAGCHVTGGDDALAFARMRYSDPTGDIGRTARQQQLVSAVSDAALSRDTLLNPFAVSRLVNAGLEAVVVDEDMSILGLGKAALVFHSAQGDQAVTGTPPLSSINYSVSGVGSTVLLDPEQSDAFWVAVRDGTFEPGTEVGGVDW